MKANHITFRFHATQRMFQRGFSVEDIRQVLDIGEVIEEYSEDSPYPSCLILGWVGYRPVHVVVAYNYEELEQIIVTVYEPDQEEWDQEFKKRIK